MKAVRIHRFGGPEVLALEDLPMPKIADDEVLIRTQAASVNPVDYKIREGRYPAVPAERLPLTLGRDLCGTVVELGRRANSVNEGDAVYAFIGPERGSYAQYAVVRRGEYARKPRLLDVNAAAAVPLAAITAWQGLFDHGALAPGERVLIHGGAGGVGHFAVQFAKAKGAEVITTVSAADIEFVQALGADEALDYKAVRFEEQICDVDLVFDLVAGETQERSWPVLKREGGRLVSTLAEPSPEKAAAHGARGLRYAARPNGRQLAEIGALIDSGEVRPYVERVFGLEEAAAAQAHLQRGHVRGKVVLHAGA